MVAASALSGRRLFYGRVDLRVTRIWRAGYRFSVAKGIAVSPLDGKCGWNVEGPQSHDFTGLREPGVFHHRISLRKERIYLLRGKLLGRHGFSFDDSRVCL